MAAAIKILCRGKYGWGFPVGSFRSCFLCLTVVLPNNPNPVVARLLRVDAEDKAIL